MKKLIALVLTILLGSNLCFAAPDQTISVAPVAVSGETISASDENARNNEISTKFNAHSHADVSVFTTNTFTIGDNAVGDKTYAINDDQSSNPALRYNTSNDIWTLSQDGSTFLAVAHTQTANGLTSGAMIYSAGTTSGAIASAGLASNGQVLIGRSGNDPVLGNITGSNNITITNGPGTINVAGPVSAAPALTLSTTNSAGSAATFVATDATVAVFDATVPSTITHGAAAATGSAGTAARRDHAHGAPTSPAWEFVESLTTTSGNSVNTATLPTDSDLFMVVFENISATAAGTGFALTGLDNHLSIRGTTVTTTADSNIAEFGQTDPKAVNGVIYIPRLARNGVIGITGTIHYQTAAAGVDSVFLRGEETSGSNFTAFTFTTSGTYSTGKIHIYKSIPS